MMLELGVLLLVAPEWLNNLAVAFVLLGVAVGHHLDRRTADQAKKHA